MSILGEKPLSTSICHGSFSLSVNSAQPQHRSPVWSSAQHKEIKETFCQMSAEDVCALKLSSGGSRMTQKRQRALCMRCGGRRSVLVGLLALWMPSNKCAPPNRSAKVSRLTVFHIFVCSRTSSCSQTKIKHCLLIHKRLAQNLKKCSVLRAAVKVRLAP